MSPHHFRTLFPFVAVTSLLIACSAESTDPSGTTDPTAPAASTKGDPALGAAGGPHADGSGTPAHPEAAASISAGLPGYASAAGGAFVGVLNHERRTWPGPAEAAWSKSTDVDGTKRTGFQFNIRADNGWIVVGAVFDAKVGETYSCESTADGAYRTAGFGFTWWNDFEHIDSSRTVDFGGNDRSQKCTITLTAYGPHRGDRVAGTVNAELDRSRGKSTIDHISVVDGRFELTQFADTPKD